MGRAQLLDDEIEGAAVGEVAPQEQGERHPSLEEVLDHSSSVLFPGFAPRGELFASRHESLDDGTKAVPFSWGDCSDPLPLRLQDDLDDLADGATASRRVGDEMGGVTDLGDGVGGAGGQADGLEHRQVGQVVADEADLPRVPGRADRSGRGRDRPSRRPPGGHARSSARLPGDRRPRCCGPRGSPTACPPGATGRSASPSRT